MPFGFIAVLHGIWYYYKNSRYLREAIGRGYTKKQTRRIRA
jgi:hypothetical protein